MSLEETRRFWDQQAPAYDDERDHGLGDPDMRRAWRELLVEAIGSHPARIADLGSGTGTLAVLLAALGHQVIGLDLSPVMVDLAREKARANGVDVEFVVGDAAMPESKPASRPELPAGQFDVVLVRHVLWAMPDPADALDRWLKLLTPGGHLVLIEGFWHTGGGLHASAVSDLLEPRVSTMTLTHLPEPIYWGHEIDDERYLISAHR